MRKIVEKSVLANMPYDHEFDVVGEDGICRREMCHATGYEVKFDEDTVWWNEYIDSNGDYRYGN